MFKLKNESTIVEYTDSNWVVSTVTGVTSANKQQGWSRNVTNKQIQLKWKCIKFRGRMQFMIGSLKTTLYWRWFLLKLRTINWLSNISRTNTVPAASTLVAENNETYSFLWGIHFSVFFHFYISSKCSTDIKCHPRFWTDKPLFSLYSLLAVSKLFIATCFVIHKCTFMFNCHLLGCTAFLLTLFLVIITLYLYHF